MSLRKRIVLVLMTFATVLLITSLFSAAQARVRAVRLVQQAQK